MVNTMIISNNNHTTGRPTVQQGCFPSLQARLEQNLNVLAITGAVLLAVEVCGRWRGMAWRGGESYFTDPTFYPIRHARTSIHSSWACFSRAE